MTYLLMALGVPLLVFGANYLVDGASSLARRLGVSEIVVGLTIIAFGTSSPELATAIYSSLRDTQTIALGNILGANVLNTLVILGATAVISPLIIRTNTLRREIPYSLLATAVCGILANDRIISGSQDSYLDRADGLILLVFFAFFLIYVITIARRSRSTPEPGKMLGLPKSLALIAGGLAGLTLGAKWLVDGAVQIAETMGVSQMTIGLTIVAIGTTLPELATAVVAVRKKAPDIAVGNVIGSNIFNILLILGVAAVIRPIPLEPQANFAIIVALLSSALLLVFMLIGKRRCILERYQGALFIALYIGYVSYLVIAA